MGDDPLHPEPLLTIPLTLALPVLLEPPSNFGKAKRLEEAQKALLEDVGAPEALQVRK